MSIYSFGVIEQDQQFKYEIKDEIIVDKIIKAMLRVNTINFEVLDRIISFIEENKIDRLRKKVLKLFITNHELLKNIKYKNYLLNKIEEYNKEKEGIVGELLDGYLGKEIVCEYKYDELKIILKNFKYSELNRFNEPFFKRLFEIYPGEVRKLFKEKIADNSNTNLDNSYRYTNLTKCKNYDTERYNNLAFCMELLKENDYYKISNYIHYLLGEYNDSLGEAILEFLKENNNYDNFLCAIDLCRLLDVSVKYWKIFEFIISNVDESDSILQEIYCLLFNTGVVTGEYGIANSFKQKYEFLEKIKTKNKKVNRFIDRTIKSFKGLYQDEKNKIDKDILIKEIKI